MSRIPALPIAIKNLLALNGLQAEAISDFNYRLRFLWRVSKCDENLVVEWYAKRDCSLQEWMYMIAYHEKERHAPTTSPWPP
jgi:hypothetical protein